MVCLIVIFMDSCLMLVLVGKLFKCIWIGGFSELYFGGKVNVGCEIGFVF